MLTVMTINLTLTVGAMVARPDTRSNRWYSREGKQETGIVLEIKEARARVQWPNNRTWIALKNIGPIESSAD